MKKFILLFALFTSFISKGQSIDYVEVYSVSPDTVIIGDSITIKFQTDKSGSAFGMSRMQLWTATYLQDCFYQWTGTWTADTNIYKVKILPEMGTGNARIYSNLTPAPGYKPFYIKSQSVISVFEFDKNATITDIKYYDIAGKEKTLISEGLSVKITTYSNGYQKREKVIFQPQ